MAALQILIGLTVEKIEEVHDYIQLLFTDGTTLSIFNNHHYDGATVLIVNRMKVESIEEGDKKIVIKFEDCSRLSIGMSDDDYNGPEAMVLRREGESQVVWN